MEHNKKTSKGLFRHLFNFGIECSFGCHNFFSHFVIFHHQNENKTETFQLFFSAFFSFFLHRIKKNEKKKKIGSKQRHQQQKEKPVACGLRKQPCPRCLPFLESFVLGKSGFVRFTLIPFHGT